MQMFSLHALPFGRVDEKKLGMSASLLRPSRAETGTEFHLLPNWISTNRGDLLPCLRQLAATGHSEGHFRILTPALLACGTRQMFSLLRTSFNTSKWTVLTC